MPRVSTSSPDSPVSIRTLLAYRLHRLANLASSSAALRYRREFDVSLAEWRSLALLGTDSPLSLNALARAAGLHKSQVSRVVSGLVERGLARRDQDSQDARGVALSLTADGRRLHRRLIAAAIERDQRLRGVLSRSERDLLDSILDRLDAEARSLVRTERLRPRRTQATR